MTRILSRCDGVAAARDFGPALFRVVELDAGCTEYAGHNPDAGCRMPDAGCRMPDAGIASGTGVGA